MPRRPVRRPLPRLGAMLASIAIAALVLAPALLAKGPPFPPPVPGQRVYDTAGVLGPAAVSAAEGRVHDIEAVSGAQVAVYTQLVPEPWANASTRSEAIALMDQWGVGRKGFDDGLVVMIDVYRGNTCHGQVYLYGGSGFNASYLSPDDLQRVYDQDMLPRLRACDFAGAVDAALGAVAQATSPEQAARLQLLRQLNSVLGLVVAPLFLVLVVGGGYLRWRRVGRDPVYLDDPSILLPAPPAGLTPAAASALRTGGPDRRAMTAASLDLAVRGYVSFRAEPGEESEEAGLGIFTGGAVTVAAADAGRVERARTRPMDPATTLLRKEMEEAAGSDDHLPAKRITRLGAAVPAFQSRLEAYLVEQGWYREAPSSVSTRWGCRSFALFFAGIAVLGIGVFLPASGLLLLGISIAVSAVLTGVIGWFMPSRTQAGAVLVAMLAAYRRTLEKTMASAASMGEVAARAAIPMIEGPDDAVVWGVALGLNEEVESVLARAVSQPEVDGSPVYHPAWYVPMRLAEPVSAGSSGAGGLAPGLMSGSPIPDFSGMMAALGTIGSSPPSTSSSSGGSSSSFGGGGSSGGGGGGGGF